MVVGNVKPNEVNFFVLSPKKKKKIAKVLNVSGPLELGFSPIRDVYLSYVWEFS